MFALTIGVGFTGYRLAGWPSLDSLYMVIITIFGVGYGEVHQLSPELKIFTSIFIIVGCTSLIYTVGAFINWLTEGQLQDYLGRRRMDREISNLENHVVICGYGRVGQMLADHLSEADRTFVIIDKDSRQVESILEQDYLFIEGDATEETVLQKARVDKASVVATVLPNDAANVFIVLSCRALNPRLTIIARANQTSSEAKLKQAGTDKVVMPATIGAQRIANIVLRPNAREILEKDLSDNIFIEGLADIGLEIDEIPVAEGSEIVGQTLRGIEAEGGYSFIVIAIRKADRSTIVRPSMDIRLESGDCLIIMTHIGADPSFRRAVRRNRADLRYRGASH